MPLIVNSRLQIYQFYENIFKLFEINTTNHVIIQKQISAPPYITCHTSVISSNHLNCHHLLVDNHRFTTAPGTILEASNAVMLNQMGTQCFCLVSHHIYGHAIYFSLKLCTRFLCQHLRTIIIGQVDLCTRSIHRSKSSLLILWVD